MKSAGINIEYLYAFTASIQGSAYVVFRIDDIEEAEAILAQNGIQTLTDKDIRDLLG